MTMRKFLGNVLSDSQLVVQIFPTAEKAPESQEKTAVQEVSRLGIFLVALEGKYPDAEHKTLFRQAHALLESGKLKDAQNLLRKPLKDVWNITVEATSSEQGHVDAMRAIGATEQAGKTIVKTQAEKLAKDTNLSP